MKAVEDLLWVYLGRAGGADIDPPILVPGESAVLLRFESELVLLLLKPWLKLRFEELLTDERFRPRK